MDYKDFIKPGNKVIFYPMSYEWDNNFDVDPQVVTIGEYRPYYTDGSPDPTPEQYCEWCRVEIVENIHGESQIRLEDLFPIEPCDKDVVYSGKEYKQIGKNDELEIAVLWFNDDEWELARYDHIQERRFIHQLDSEELCRLFNQVGVGSMFTSDYMNDLGIPETEAMAEIEEFCESNDWDDDFCCAANFVDYVLA